MQESSATALTKESKSVQRSYYLTPSLDEEFAKAAQYKNRSRNSIITQAVKEFVLRTNALKAKRENKKGA